MKLPLVAKVDRYGIETRKTMADYEAKIEGNKVLLLCHGYNNPKDSVLAAYELIKGNHRALVNYFDVVVGYTWPGGGNFATYPGARGRTSAVAARFRDLLKITIPKCSELGVMSHSMGCRISLIAHTQLYRKGISKANKHWQYLMAPAVDDESIEHDEKYEPATLYCDNTYVFHSMTVSHHCLPAGKTESEQGYVRGDVCRNARSNSGLRQFL